MIRKAALQIGVPALLAFIAWNAYLAVNHLQRVQKTAARTLESSAIQAELSGVFRDLTDMETGQRGYLLTGDPCATQEFDLRRYRHAVRWLAPVSRDPGRPKTGRSRWFRANGRDARDRGTTPPLPLPVRASPCRETEC